MIMGWPGQVGQCGLWVKGIGMLDGSWKKSVSRKIYAKSRPDAMKVGSEGRIFREALAP